uniref:Uncharacterized protein n=1 Tax=Ananas comosus var. bracteatus TaxID=296719 RepID=A0A6V7QGE9_ANACO|nr:unnamed protein product [Ananas comosus var. bracteatus]
MPQPQQSHTEGVLALVSSECNNAGVLLIEMRPSCTNLLNIYRMVTDIPATTDASFGREIVRYESPQPAMGIHRLAFVLYQQRSRQMAFVPLMRENFCTSNFAHQHNLGSPVAAAYFNCQRESGSGGRRFRQAK